MPVFVYRAKEEGPSLLLCAGIHGDEINGIEVVRRMISRNQISPDRGVVIAIPLVNIYGFINNSRTLPGGRDLNRSFPGGTSGSLARKIAHIMMKEVVPNIDCGVDFHTGGNRIANYPQIRAVLNEPENKELSLAFGAPLTINSNLIDRSFRKAAFQKGKHIIVYEGGESLRMDRFAVEEGINGVNRLMKHLGMKNNGLEHRKTRILGERAWSRAKISGILSSKVDNGEEVKRNQVLAVITDPYGKMRIPVKSPVNGCIIGQNNMPVVNAGDALFHIGVDME